MRARAGEGNTLAAFDFRVRQAIETLELITKGVDDDGRIQSALEIVGDHLQRLADDMEAAAKATK